MLCTLFFLAGTITWPACLCRRRRLYLGEADSWHRWRGSDVCHAPLAALKGGAASGQRHRTGQEFVQSLVLKNVRPWVGTRCREMVAAWKLDIQGRASALISVLNGLRRMLQRCRTSDPWKAALEERPHPTSLVELG